MKINFKLMMGAMLLSVGLQAQNNAEGVARKIADRIIRTTTYNFEDIRTGKIYQNVKGLPLKKEIQVKSVYNQWHYTNGVTHLALMELANKTGDIKYEKYVLKNMDFVFNPDHLEYYRKLYDKTFKEEGWMALRKVSWHMYFRSLRLDDNGPMGASLIELQKKYPNEMYEKYIQQTAQHLKEVEPRLEDGTIARIWPHENTIWADDAFMAISFLARMGAYTGDQSYFTDAANQVLNYTKYLWIKENQLYIHCYHTDTKEHGVAHWSRANGWVMMAQADLLQLMPDNHPLKEKVIENFKMQVQGIIRYQGKNGLWHQVLDKVDSYEEITGTAMFTFSIARGVKEGWIHPEYTAVAESGLKGILSKITPSGDVTDICVGTGIMPALSYYYNRPKQVNDPMGEGPVLRALVEMIDLKKFNEERAEEKYDRLKSKIKD